MWSQRGALIGQILSTAHRKLPLTEQRAAAKKSLSSSIKNRLHIGNHTSKAKQLQQRAITNSSDSSLSINGAGPHEPSPLHTSHQRDSFYDSSPNGAGTPEDELNDLYSGSRGSSVMTGETSSLEAVAGTPDDRDAEQDQDEAAHVPFDPLLHQMALMKVRKEDQEVYSDEPEEMERGTNAPAEREKDEILANVGERKPDREVSQKHCL